MVCGHSCLDRFIFFPRVFVNIKKSIEPNAGFISFLCMFETASEVKQEGAKEEQRSCDEGATDVQKLHRGKRRKNHHVFTIV